MHLYYLLPAQVTTIQTPYSRIVHTCVGDIRRETFSFYKITKVCQSWALGLARPHLSVETQRILQSVGMLSWPARPPGLSPIDLLRDIIGQQPHHHPQPALTAPNKTSSRSLITIKCVKRENYLKCPEIRGGLRQLEASSGKSALLVEWLRQQTKLPHLSEANPQVYVETPLHPEKLTVWCVLWAGGILLQNDEGHNVTVNGDRYRAMITNFFIPELNNHDVQELGFQQDGATCHTARATIDLLKDTFGDRLISRFGPVNWPPRSCDLTPLDYFLWGYVKSLVYAG
ncbi:hypothetical protein TNCV_3168251 [Trichonephila clavipes]|nr:hypothetical protein TNCV_3168251 [Trichonephila clavipes]